MIVVLPDFVHLQVAIVALTRQGKYLRRVAPEILVIESRFKLPTFSQLPVHVETQVITGESVVRKKIGWRFFTIQVEGFDGATPFR